MALTIEPVTTDFVANVSGIDLAGPLDDSVIAQLSAAIDRYAVLVFRGQRLDDARQVAFAERFGPLETSASLNFDHYKHRLSHPALADISNLDEKQAIRARTDRQRMIMLGNMLWHTDSSYKAIPGALSMLYAHVVPSAGGETQFADLRAAYDSLPERRKSEIENLVAEHSLMQSRAIIGFDEFSDDERRAMRPVPQRLVRTHPGSGRKTLFLASHAGQIVGWPVPEGRMLLLELIEIATQREFVHTHDWSVGDLVIWDNRCTMHRGRPYDEREVRDLRRVTTSDVISTLEREPLP